MKAASVWLACLLLLAGCSHSEGPLEGLAESDESVTVRLVLNMPSAAADNTDAGESVVGNESWISTQDVQLLVYREDGTFADKASMSRVTPIEATANHYLLTGTLTRLRKADVESGTQYRIVMLANMLGTLHVDFPYDGVPDREEDLYNDRLTFDFPIDNSVTREILNKDPNGRIPMWGKRTGTLRNGEAIEVDMLRALAKVKVSLSAALVSSNHILNGVEVQHGHIHGSMVPAGAAEMDNTPSSKDDYRINVEGEYNSTVPFVESPEEIGVFYTYLPEQKKGNSHMKVTINDDTYELYFGDYATLTKFPVVRNHYYEFTITKVNPSGELHYSVCDWNEIKVDDIEFD